jgi:hypothetical protein
MNQNRELFWCFATAFFTSKEAIFVLLTRILSACYLAVRWRFEVAGCFPAASKNR